MANNPELLKHLEVVSQRERHHHDILWEEEKHYSWWVYVVFAGLVFIYSHSNPAFLPEYKIIAIIFGTFLGVWLSISAIRVIHLESKYLHEARQLYTRTIIALELHKHYILCNELLVPEIEFKDMDCVRYNANKFDFGIRSIFKYHFLLVAHLFVGFMIFSIITLT